MLRLKNLAQAAGDSAMALGGDGVGPEVVGATVRNLGALEPGIAISEPIHGTAAVEQGLEALQAVSPTDQVVTFPDGSPHSFEIDAFRKTCVLRGVDDVKLSQELTKELATFEEKYFSENPWLRL